MIALAIFAVFIVSFIAGHGYNIQDSTSMRTELQLKEYALEKINEIITSPPELKESLTLKPETGKFERNEVIKWEVTYKTFEMPDFDKILGNDPDSEEGGDEDPEGAAVQKKILEVASKNLKELIWQVEVKVIDTNTDNAQVISTWLYNDKAKVKVEGF